MAATASTRQRKLAQDGAKGLAGRLLNGAGDPQRESAPLRSAVKRFSGRAADGPAPAPTPQAKVRKRSTRAEQAAAGMMSPPPGSFDEKIVRGWLAGMSDEELGKLSRLMEIARQGRSDDHPAWSRVKRGFPQKAPAGAGKTGERDPRASSRHAAPRWRERSDDDDWGRRLARIKDFING